MDKEKLHELNEMLRQRDEELVKNIVESLSKKITLNVTVEPQLQEFDRRFALLDSKEPVIRKHIGEYLRAVEYVQQHRRIKRKEKLIKLITPLHEISKIYTETLQTRTGSGKWFINAETINFETEINLESLKYDEDKYQIDVHVGSRQIIRIYPSDYYRHYLDFCRDAEQITEADFDEMVKSGKIRFNQDPPVYLVLGWTYVRETGAWTQDGKTANEQMASKLNELVRSSPNSNQSISLRELYECQIEVLSEKILKSKDLLHQILVNYTIKRALNGDERAIDKLYSLYEKKALKQAKDWADSRNRYEEKNIDDFQVEDKGQNSPVATHIERDEEVHRHCDDFEYLKDIEATAKHCLRHLLSGFSPKEFIESLLSQEENPFLPLPKWVEIFYFEWFSVYVPMVLMKLFNNPSISSSPFEDILFFLNPYTSISSEFEYQRKKSVRRFNSYCFRPNSKTNLTVWLFGGKWHPKKSKKWHSAKMMGKFAQMLKASIPSPRKKNDTSKPAKYIPDENDFASAIEALVGKGISRRDAEIFLKNKLLKCKQIQLAEEYDLSTRHISRIILPLKRTYPIR